jgi:hypothetical protein
MCYKSTEHTLNHIGSIKAIHAIRSKGTILRTNNLEIRWLIKLHPIVKAVVDFSDEISIVAQFVLTDVNQLGEVFPLHVLAFSVEIKPDIAQICIIQIPYDFIHLLANSKL